MWTIRKAVWNKLAVLKFGANKPVRIPVPEDDGRTLKAVSLASLFPRIPVANVLIGDHVPAALRDERPLVFPHPLAEHR